MESPTIAPKVDAAETGCDRGSNVYLQYYRGHLMHQNTFQENTYQLTKMTSSTEKTFTSNLRPTFNQSVISEYIC